MEEIAITTEVLVILQNIVEIETLEDSWIRKKN